MLDFRTVNFVEINCLESKGSYKKTKFFELFKNKQRKRMLMNNKIIKYNQAVLRIPNNRSTH
jgi:hypothetical protein